MAQRYLKVLFVACILISQHSCQTEHEGRYFNEQSMWNPRLFAYLKTSEKGIFAIETIQPGHYKDDEGH